MYGVYGGYLLFVFGTVYHAYVCLCVCVIQPEVLEQIHNLKELWMDNNSLQSIPGVRDGTHTHSHTHMHMRTET